MLAALWWGGLAPTGVAAASGPTISADEYANVRQAPSTAAAIVARVTNGAAVGVLTADCDASLQPWLQVERGDVVGWVAAQLVDAGSGARAHGVLSTVSVRDAPWGRRVGQVTAGQWVGVVGATCDSDGEAWLELRGGGYAYAAYLQMEGAPTPKVKQAVAFGGVPEAAYIRAGVGGAVTGEVSAGRSVAVLSSSLGADGYWWHQVLYGRRAGWMRADTLRLTAVDEVPARMVVAQLQGGASAVLYAFENGTLERVMAAWAGPTHAPTPRGTFTVQARLGTIHTSQYRWTRGHEWYLPHFIQFSGDYGIHGPMVDERTLREVYDATAGCLMPNPEHAAWLYAWLRPGDRVVIQ